MKRAMFWRWAWAVVALLVAGRVSEGQTELRTDRAVYLPGEPIRVSFTEGPGNAKDWIGLYNAGADTRTYITWQYLDGTQVGTRTLTEGEVVFTAGGPKAGDYLLRLLINDNYMIAAEAEFSVAVVPRVRTDKAIYKPGEAITVEFLNGPGNAKDWIGLHLAEPAPSTRTDWAYVDGTQTGQSGKAAGTVRFAAGLVRGGEYAARLFENDGFTVLDIAPFKVVEVGPAVRLEPGDGQVRISWEAATQPSPVAKYEVWSGPKVAGPFTRVAEVTGLEYLHTGLPNGVEVSYKVRAVSAGGTLGPDSEVETTAPYALGVDDFISYVVPHGLDGNYSFNGVLGMTFEVLNPISVRMLGVFDDGQNGLKRSLRVRLYDQTTRQVRATLTFDGANPGVLKGGSRFKNLTTPLALPVGFKGVITADGFGAEEKAGNSATGDLGLRTAAGRGSIYFMGSVFGDANTFPTRTEGSDSPNLYAAGTFEFSATAPVAPGKPVVRAIPGDGVVNLSWAAISAPLAAAKYRIERGASAEGTFQVLGEAVTAGYEDRTVVNGTRVYYRVTAVAVGGEVGSASEVVAITPEVPRAGIAYAVAEGTEGNQAFGGAAGNDFDVVRPIRVTRLGVFDDGSDGLKRPLKAQLYDRRTQVELAMQEFTPESAGELIGGSRFKDLAAAVSLPIGFQGTIVASGYGAEEREANRGLGSFEQELFTGGCLEFVGRSRWGEDPNAFPQIIDGGPEDRYATGTFRFEPAPLEEASSMSIAADGDAVRVTWTGGGVLQSAGNVAGPWDVVPGATSGARIVAEGSARFFRVRSP